MTVNAFLIVAGVLLLGNVISGFKKGMVREIISFISLVFLCITVALLGKGLTGYLKGEFVKVGFVVLLLAVLGIAHHFLKLILMPAKLISKLPIVHGVDRLLGVVVGIVETVLMLWTIYVFIMMADLGITGTFLRESIAEIPLLTWLYEHNQLAVWIEYFGAKIGFSIADASIIR